MVPRCDTRATRTGKGNERSGAFCKGPSGAKIVYQMPSAIRFIPKVSECASFSDLMDSAERIPIPFSRTPAVPSPHAKTGIKEHFMFIVLSIIRRWIDFQICLWRQFLSPILGPMVEDSFFFFVHEFVCTRNYTLFIRTH